MRSAAFALALLSLGATVAPPQPHGFAQTWRDLRPSVNVVTDHTGDAVGAWRITCADREGGDVVDVHAVRLAFAWEVAAAMGCPDALVTPVPTVAGGPGRLRHPRPYRLTAISLAGRQPNAAHIRAANP